LDLGPSCNLPGNRQLPPPPPRNAAVFHFLNSLILASSLTPLPSLHTCPSCPACTQFSHCNPLPPCCQSTSRPGVGNKLNNNLADKVLVGDRLYVNHPPPPPPNPHHGESQKPKHQLRTRSSSASEENIRGHEL